jgi:hypothetical protein
MRRRFGDDWCVRELRLQEDAQLRNASTPYMDGSGQRNDAHIIFNINGSYQLVWPARSRRCRSARGGTLTTTARLRRCRRECSA